MYKRNIENLSGSRKRILSLFTGRKKRKAWNKTRGKYMPEERRQNLAWTDRASCYNREEWLREFLDDIQRRFRVGCGGRAPPFFATTCFFAITLKNYLCYSNTTLTVVRNVTVLSSTTDKTNRISNHFMWVTTSIKIKYKLPKNYVVLLCLWWKGAQRLLENCHINRVLPSRDSETKRSDSEN